MKKKQDAKPHITHLYVNSARMTTEFKHIVPTGGKKWWEQMKLLNAETVAAGFSLFEQVKP